MSFGLGIGALEATLAITTLVGEKARWVLPVQVDVAEHSGGAVVGLIVELISVGACKALKSITA